MSVKTISTERIYENVTVKFHIISTQIVAHVYSNRLKIKDIKEDIGAKFKIESPYLVIAQNDEILTDNQSLYDLYKNSYGIIDLNLGLSKDAIKNNVVLDINIYYSHYTLPEIITVYIDENGGQCKEVVVEIENKSISKPFLGGYKYESLEFHDAFTQTGPPKENIKLFNVCRDSQTVKETICSVDTPSTKAIQSFGQAPPLLHVAELNNYELTPRTFINHEEMEKKTEKLKKIKLIQKNFRAYLVKKFIREKAAEFRGLYLENKRRVEEMQNIDFNKYKKECISKIYPKTKEDFDVLYAQVQKWKKDEINKIKELHFGGPRIAAMTGLLDKEIQLLCGIEEKRSLIKNELKEIRNDKILEKLGKPVNWIGYKNMRIEMDTLETQKTRYLTTYYQKLKLKQTKKERLQLLSEVQQVMDKETDTDHSIISELTKLFEREMFMLNSNVDVIHLEPLEQRQQSLFLNMIKTKKHPKTKCNVYF